MDHFLADVPAVEHMITKGIVAASTFACRAVVLVEDGKAKFSFDCNVEGPIVESVGSIASIHANKWICCKWR